MKRLADILADMASAPESEFDRLLAEVMISTREKSAAGMSGEDATHPRAKGRHGVKATLARANRAADATEGGPLHRPSGSTREGDAEPVGNKRDGARSSASWEVGGEVKVGRDRNTSCDRNQKIRIVWNNPAMPTMDMCLGRASRRNERSPRSALSRQMFIVIAGGKRH